MSPNVTGVSLNSGPNSGYHGGFRFDIPRVDMPCRETHRIHEQALQHIELADGYHYHRYEHISLGSLVYEGTLYLIEGRDEEDGLFILQDKSGLI